MICGGGWSKSRFGGVIGDVATCDIVFFLVLPNSYQFPLTNWKVYG